MGHRQQCRLRSDTASSADPDRISHNVVSDQDLHCLLTEWSIKILIKMKNITQQPLKQQWTGSIDKSGTFHSAYMD